MNRRKKWFLGCGCLGLSALGVLALLVGVQMLARAKPWPVVEVVTCHPGMPAATVEKTITNRIERWVNQAHGANEVTSRSLAGVSIVRVYFGWDTDADAALTMVTQLVQGVLPTLPPDTPPPFVLPRDPRYSEPLGVLGVNSATVDDTVIWELAKISIRSRLMMGVPGAVAPFVLGGRDREVVINFDPNKMAARKVSLEDVPKALKAVYGQDLVCTVLEDSLWLDGSTRIFKLGELNELGVRTEDGEVVRLGDIGIVQDQSAMSGVRFRIDGRRGVGVPVYLQRDAPRQDVYEKLTAILPSLRGEAEMVEAQLRWVPLGAEHKWLRAQDDGLLKIYLRAPSNARLSNTEKRVALVEGFLEKSVPEKEREAILSEMGMMPDIWALFTANAGPMDATIFVQLSRDRTLSAAAYASKLRRLLRDEASFADLAFRFASHDMPAPVDIRIEGGSREEAMRLAQQIRKQLTAIKGTVDVDVAQRMDAPQLTLSADHRKAAALGLRGRAILSQVVTALKLRAPLDSDFWTDVTTGSQSLTVPYSEDPDAKLEDVLNIAVAGGNAEQPVKLSSLVNLKRTTTAVEIDHSSLQRVFDVRANIEDRDRGDVIADIRKILKELAVPEGMQVELANEK